MILMRGTDAELKEKAKKLEKHKIQGLHYFEMDMERRLNSWNESNNVANYHDSERPVPVMRFFQERETEIFEVDQGKEETEIFEAIRIYVERHGRPFNYLPSMEHNHMERRAKLDNAETDARMEAELEEKER